MVSYRRGFALMAERKVGRQPDPPRPLDPVPEHHDILPRHHCRAIGLDHHVGPQDGVFGCLAEARRDVPSSRTKDF
jgi:hypothetical protein